MNDQTGDPQTSEDDIPTLTEIVVPGRVQGTSGSERSLPLAQEDARPGFEVEFDVTLDELDDLQPVELTESDEPAEPEDIDLPLPWPADDPPKAFSDVSVDGVVDVPAEAFQAQVVPASLAHAGSVPLIVAAQAKAEAEQAQAVEAQDDKDAQLRALVSDIGDSLELRLQAEIALIEQRLRAAVREELDACLRQLKERDRSAD